MFWRVVRRQCYGPLRSIYGSPDDLVDKRVALEFPKYYRAMTAKLLVILALIKRAAARKMIEPLCTCQPDKQENWRCELSGPNELFGLAKETPGQGSGDRESHRQKKQNYRSGSHSGDECRTRNHDE